MRCANCGKEWLEPAIVDDRGSSDPEDHLAFCDNICEGAFALELTYTEE